MAYCSAFNLTWAPGALSRKIYHFLEGLGKYLREIREIPLQSSYEKRKIKENVSILAAKGTAKAGELCVE